MDAVLTQMLGHPFETLLDGIEVFRTLHRLDNAAFAALSPLSYLQVHFVDLQRIQLPQTRLAAVGAGRIDFDLLEAFVQRQVVAH